MKIFQPLHWQWQIQNDNSDDDGEILQNNINDSDNDIDIEPSDYELLHDKNIEERKRMYELAGL